MKTPIGEILSDIQQKNQKVLLAVSGGVDSMVMMELMYRKEIQLGVVHFNFGLRGKAAEQDAQLVAAESHQKNLPFYQFDFDTQKYAEENKVSIQMAARRLRYQKLEEIRAEHAYDYIATAHHKNDLTEGLLLNMVRGTGLHGLKGIDAIQNGIIRPLIAWKKSEIYDFAQKAQIPFREDASNQEVYYKRNFIRNKIIPELKTLNPALEDTFAENADYCRLADEFIQMHFRHKKAEMLQHKGATTIVKVQELLQCHPLRLYIYELFKDFGLGGAQLKDFYEALCKEQCSGSKKFYTDTHLIEKSRSSIFICPKEVVDVEGKKSTITLGENQETSFGGFVFGFEKMAIRDVAHLKDVEAAFFDADLLTEELVFRFWQKGDYFYPLGFNHKKKVAHFFKNQKLSYIEKMQTVVVESGGEVLWLVGQRQDQRFSIGPNTRNVLKISFQKA